MHPQHSPIDVAHRLRVFSRTIAVAMLLALARAITKRGREPELPRLAGPARAGERDAQERVDTLELEVGGVLGGRPPDVRAGLEHEGRGIGGIARRQLGEIARGAAKIPAVERVQARAHRSEGLGVWSPRVGRTGKRERALQHQHNRDEGLHVSGARQ